MMPSHLRPRCLILETPGQLTFPGTAALHLRFQPDPSFGGHEVPGSIVSTKGKARVEWNANTGTHRVIPEVPLDPVQLSVTNGETEIRISGTDTTVASYCQARGDLLNVLAAFGIIWPLVLSVQFNDPPQLAQIGGEFNGVSFNWQYETGSNVFFAVDEAQRDRLANGALEYLGVRDIVENPRIIAALHYFRTACRLARVGAATWEFTAEIVLNFAKILEVLFPPSTRDAVREGLGALGVAGADQERLFLPSMALRANLDVAHVSLTQLSFEQLRPVHRYLDDAETAFRNMLQRLLLGLKNGTTPPPKYQDEGPGEQLLTVLDRIRKEFALGVDQ